MAFDPRHEDYQRLGLRFARSLDEGDTYSPLRAFASFGREFARNRDALPQSDADRAFHLVALATEVIDYEIPFAPDDQVEPLITRGRQLLSEAVSLDESCHDAIRMLAASKSTSFEEYFHFLKDGADAVAASCEQNRRKAVAELSDERVSLGEDIALRPYKRWLASEASMALICGQNREAIRIGNELLSLDKNDAADVRFTMFLAFAKLEDEQGLDELASRVGLASKQAPQDAWMRIARVTLAYKQCDYKQARKQLQLLIQSYPHAAYSLVRQLELFEGVFARLSVPPFSEDELILAISESAVLLQEGIEVDGRGVFGDWVARTVAEMYPAAARELDQEQGNRA